LESSLYFNLWEPAVVAGWISHFENVLPDALSQAVSLVPAEWYKGNIDLLHDVLLHRLENLSGLIEADGLASNQAIRRSMVNEILRLPRDGVHMLGTST